MSTDAHGAAMTPLTTSVKNAIGGATATELTARLGIETVGDLLRHYPRRYYDRGDLTDLAALRPGDLVTVQANVVSARGRQLKPKLHKLDVVVSDGRSELAVTFFNRRYLIDRLVPGAPALLAGKVEMFNRRLTLTNPELALGEDVEDFAGRLMPVYPATAKLPSWRLAKAVQVALDVALPADVLAADPVPPGVRERRHLLPWDTAVRLVHRPESRDDVRRSRDRLRFDEAFVLQVVLAQRRTAAAALPAVARVARPDGLLAAFDRRLPFTLTDGQRAVAEVLEADLARPHPMHRLLQGEVGSGKTVVALRAMLAVVDAGGQAALLAPTEVLAQQHHRTIRTLLGPLGERGFLGGDDLGTRVALLTGSQGTARRRANLLDAASGDAGIVVGTHALIQDTVSFQDLGLVVVDEQHRFGVEQRDALRAKASVPPHVLVMTATPIPRTVAMTVFGDLDVSTLTELPAGRSPITTHVVPGELAHFVDRAWSRVREEVDAGHRVYVVCPRIGDGETGEDLESPGVDDGDADTTASRPPLAVLDVATQLVDGPLAGLRLAVLHGRMPPEVKDEVMQDFAEGNLDVLVATTVVEVGLDVPEAAVMVVMDAERFGVSQLHQLRGRVGRGAVPGLCLLVTEAEAGSPARERLAAVAATTDGFALSQLDLETRREGDVLGVSQSGRRSSLRLLSVLRDEAVIEAAREDAVAVVATDPTLAGHPALCDAVDAVLADSRADYLDKA